MISFEQAILRQVCSAGQEATEARAYRLKGRPDQTSAPSIARPRRASSGATPRSIDGEAVEKAGAAGGCSAVVAAPARRVRRIPRLRRRDRVEAHAIVMADDRRTLAPLLVQLPQVVSSLPAKAVPSGCDPVRMSC